VLEVALVTCRSLPGLDPDDRLLLEPLASLGCRVAAAAWDDRQVDWERFDVSVIRSTWDYTGAGDAFVAWARSVPRLLNPPSVVAWNTDKRYLVDLAAAGIPVVSTAWISDAASVELPTAGEHVLKPSVGAGSLDAARFDLGDPGARARATAHARRLLAAGQTVMVQPFAHAIEESGETGVILIDGKLSHAIRKSVRLGPGKLEQVEGLYLEETITAHTPSAAEVDLALAAVGPAPDGGEPLLYARVDMVPDADGQPMLMELELTEPSLFMVTAPATASLFAEAIAARARRMAASRT